MPDLHLGRHAIIAPIQFLEPIPYKPDRPIQSRTGSQTH